MQTVKFFLLIFLFCPGCFDLWKEKEPPKDKTRIELNHVVSLHPPYAEGQCNHCHVDTQKIEAKGIYMPVSRLIMGFAPEEKIEPRKLVKICYRCHSQKEKVRHKIFESRQYHHDVVIRTCVGGVFEWDGCHDPHVGRYNSHRLLRPQPALCSNMECHWGVLKKHKEALTEEKGQNCTRCHEPHGGGLTEEGKLGKKYGEFSPMKTK